MLRQPLEEGRVTISRALNSTTFPARFVLVAAMNPCPCGYLGDSRHACKCSPVQVERYRARISGPLLVRDSLSPAPLTEAIAYRSLDRGLWVR